VRVAALHASLDDHGVEVARRQMQMLGANHAIAVRGPRLREGARKQLGRLGREYDFVALFQWPEPFKVSGGEGRRGRDGNESGILVRRLAAITDGLAGKSAATAECKPLTIREA